MKHMKNFNKLIIAFLVASCLGASAALAAGQSSEDWNKNIVGAWVEESAPNGGLAIFYEDGRYEARIESDQQVTAIAKGKWWIRNGKLYNTISSLEPPVIPVKKEPYIDTIVDISTDVMTLIDEDGLKYKKIRVLNK